MGWIYREHGRRRHFGELTLVDRGLTQTAEGGCPGIGAPQKLALAHCMVMVLAAVEVRMR